MTIITIRTDGWGSQQWPTSPITTNTAKYKYNGKLNNEFAM